MRERTAVDRAHDRPLDLNDGLRPDHLQIEHDAPRADSVDHLAQDVHDVLRVDASERP